MSITATVGETAHAATATRADRDARLDRLPISSFHKRMFWLIGAGMFFDGYDLYVGTSVLGATLSSGFSTLAQNAQFVSLTFIGMTIGVADRRLPRRCAMAGASPISSICCCSASPRSARRSRRRWNG